jgi:hypothetical protein
MSGIAVRLGEEGKERTGNWKQATGNRNGTGEIDHEGPFRKKSRPRERS